MGLLKPFFFKQFELYFGDYKHLKFFGKEENIFSNGFNVACQLEALNGRARITFGTSIDSIFGAFLWSSPGVK